MNDDARRRAEAFAREVEAAMVGMSPRRRAELSAGLADHLLEPGVDGTPLIDTEDLDPRSYAEELRAAGPAIDPSPEADDPPTDGPSRGRRLPLLAGAALLTLVVAGGTWAVVTQPWNSDVPQPVSTAAPSPAASPEDDLIYVPDVRGLSREEATVALEDLGLSVIVIRLPEGETVEGATYVPSDAVATTEPFRGEAVTAGSEVLIMVMP